MGLEQYLNQDKILVERREAKLVIDLATKHLVPKALLVGVLNLELGDLQIEIAVVHHLECPHSLVADILGLASRQHPIEGVHL